ncbi:bifunctional arginine demethylase and lysyl-hydroxylase psr-1-like [Acanthaster planci]|uniref:Bifunctional arginine demethylase and lysyl-hydroxylase psr-1-like n=1 Tax=Acanthaster planci TaxID=133434 RepID=A0A8B7YFH7_ACAPL|nr:bifunctional arginine demethylase and lysyl-hydroxylase psr-1-like [Acanthaster planci]XP_022091990.1 bifunctional arginine demethylase and lysyl-hydroxylase psr-1-like [Acanthaster planci]
MDVRKRFTEIHQRLQELGTAGDQLTQLPSFKKLQTLSQSKSTSRIVRIVTLGFFWAVVLALVLAYIAIMLLVVGSNFLEDPRLEQVHRSLSQVWMERVMDANMDTETCLMAVPETLQDLFRPPVNCSICRDVEEIKKLSGLTQEEFERLYAYTARPVVVTDGMEQWTALQVLSFDFFKEIYSDKSPVLESNSPDCQFFPYRTNFDSLKEVLEMAPERANLSDGSAPWYIGWSNCDSTAANTLRQHYHRPYFLPPESESSKTDWIFMGSPGYGAHMHIDDVELPSWQAQVKGHKRWTLEPPPECYLECQTLEVEVHPGEIIVLDTNKWFHQTLIIGDEMSITIGSEYD